MSESEATRDTRLHFSNALIILCAMTLCFLLLSWALGGYDFYDSLLGNYATFVLLAGIAMGIALKLGQRNRHQANDEEMTAARNGNDSRRSLA